MPASTIRLGRVNLPIAGGGYFRLLPYAWTKWGMQRVNRLEKQPVVFYMHPWEIDPEQPRLKSRGKRGISTHYINLHSMEDKLRRLLSDFRFAPVHEVLRERGFLAS